MDIGLAILLFACLLGALVAGPKIRKKFWEWRVSSLLQRQLRAPDYVLLNDVRLPFVNGADRADHLLVSRYGIFVIDTRSFTDWVLEHARAGRRMPAGGDGKPRFPNPFMHNFEQIKALESVTGLEQRQFHSIVVFAGLSHFRKDIPAEVCLVPELVERIRQQDRPLLTEAQVKKAVDAVGSGACR